MNRRFFLKILLSLGLGSYFPKLTEAARFDYLHTPQDNYKPFYSVKFLRQIITADSRTSRILMWQSDDEIKNIQLEYFFIGDDSANFGEVDYKYFDDNFIYSCKLENLKPESLYKFRIIADDRATAWQNLRTAGDENFQILIFSDSQCEHYEVWQKVADHANKNFPDAEIFLVNGDIVDNGQANYQWRAWYNAAALLLADKIFAPVMGNHECYNSEWLNCLPEGYLNNFILPTNSEKNFEGYFYSFDYGAAHFIILNTQFDELDKFLPKLKDTQHYWLRNDVKNSNRAWKIIFMHKDIFDYAQNKFNDIAENFMNLFDELEIDIVFTGHLHTYRNRGKIFAQKKSPHGTTYILCGRSGDQKYVEPNSEIDDVVFENLRAEPESFITLDINRKNLTLTCYTVENEILDKFTLKKSNINGVVDDF